MQKLKFHIYFRVSDFPFRISQLSTSMQKLKFDIYFRVSDFPIQNFPAFYLSILRLPWCSWGGSFMAIRKLVRRMAPLCTLLLSKKGITVVQDEHILKLRACSKENL